MKKILLALCAAALILAGCIDYNEEMTVNKDSSGQVTMKIMLPNAMFQMSDDPEGLDISKMTKQFADKPGIKLIEEKEYTEGDKKVFLISLEFDSFEALKQTEDAKEGFFTGKITLEKLDDGKIKFKRELIADNLMGDKEKKEDDDEGGLMQKQMQNAMIDMMFGQNEWVYKKHMPYKIISANTSDDLIDFKNNTVEWKIPLPKIIKSSDEPYTLEVIMEPERSKVILILLLILAVILLIIAVLVKKKRAAGNLPPASSVEETEGLEKKENNSEIL